MVKIFDLNQEFYKLNYLRKAHITILYTVNILLVKRISGGKIQQNLHYRYIISNHQLALNAERFPKR